MTKAIIVIDIPDGTKPEDYKVDLKIYNFKKYRGYTIHDFNDQNVLKSMPEKISHSEIDSPYDHYDNWKIDGYNACIDEILGDKE